MTYLLYHLLIQKNEKDNRKDNRKDSIHKTQKNDKQITNYVQTNDRLILHWVAPSIPD